MASCSDIWPQFAEKSCCSRHVGASRDTWSAARHKDEVLQRKKFPQNETLKTQVPREQHWETAYDNKPTFFLTKISPFLGACKAILRLEIYLACQEGGRPLKAVLEGLVAWDKLLLWPIYRHHNMYGQKIQGFPKASIRFSWKQPQAKQKNSDPVLHENKSSLRVA